MKYLLLAILFIVSMLRLIAQPTSGTTGLLNIPTAEMQRDGTFLFGSNYLPEPITPERFSYNTGNYYINITFLPFWEVNYRLTLFHTESTGKYDRQDRSFSIRGRILKERTYIPALVIGGNDLYTHTSKESNQNFGALYLVTTKAFHWQKHVLSATLGYGIDVFEKNQYEGLFGGIAITPGFFKPLSIITEYDSHAINTGASLLLFNHIYIQAFAYDLKYFCGGIQYRVYLEK